MAPLNSHLLAALCAHDRRNKMKNKTYPIRLARTWPPLLDVSLLQSIQKSSSGSGLGLVMDSAFVRWMIVGCGRKAFFDGRGFEVLAAGTIVGFVLEVCSCVSVADSCVEKVDSVLFVRNWVAFVWLSR